MPDLVDLPPAVRAGIEASAHAASVYAHTAGDHEGRTVATELARLAQCVRTLGDAFAELGRQVAACEAAVIEAKNRGLL